MGRPSSMRRALASGFSSLHVQGWPSLGPPPLRRLAQVARKAASAVAHLRSALALRSLPFVTRAGRLAVGARASATEWLRAAGFTDVSARRRIMARLKPLPASVRLHLRAPLQKKPSEPAKMDRAAAFAELSKNEARLKVAERNLREVTRTYQRRLEAATHHLDEVKKQAERPLATEHGAILFEDRIETLQGVARFAEGPVEASVHAAPLAGAAQVMVDTPQFLSVVPCKPRRAEKFAQLINQAALRASHVREERAAMIATAQDEVRKVQAERDEQLRAAELHLEAVRLGHDRAPETKK